eukprot:TRINITY_DN11811_c0_g2_i1.p1 TRINITY_DN11811_c0_g2~~TRINITY_DN11811_c0_g2_i1.p1  ORF type:complete len:440 (+),score=109.96 TRINITY_DN11811_c0_g2_i1:309-1628(+)
MSKIESLKASQSDVIMSEKDKRDESDIVYSALAIDGGGGKSSALLFAFLLQHIEDSVCKPIYEIFDFLGGSLSANFITLGLTLPLPGTNRPRYSASDIVDLLEDEQRIIFPIANVKPTKYQRGQLDELLKATFGTANFSSCLRPTLLPALIRRTSKRMEPWEAYAFQSWQAQMDPHSDFKIWELLRCTLMPPTSSAQYRLTNILGTIPTFNSFLEDIDKEYSSVLPIETLRLSLNNEQDWICGDSFYNTNPSSLVFSGMESLHQYNQIFEKPTHQNTHLLFLGPEINNESAITPSRGERSRSTFRGANKTASNYLLAKPKLKSSLSSPTLPSSRNVVGSLTQHLSDPSSKSSSSSSSKQKLPGVKTLLPLGSSKKGLKIDSNMRELLDSNYSSIRVKTTSGGLDKVWMNAAAELERLRDDIEMISRTLAIKMDSRKDSY